MRLKSKMFISLEDVKIDAFSSKNNSKYLNTSKVEVLQTVYPSSERYGTDYDPEFWNLDPAQDNEQTWSDLERQSRRSSKLDGSM